MQIVTQLYLVFNHLRRESTVVHEPSTKDESVNKSDWVSTVFFGVHQAHPVRDEHRE